MWIGKFLRTAWLNGSLEQISFVRPILAANASFCSCYSHYRKSTQQILWVFWLPANGIVHQSQMNTKQRCFLLEVIFAAKKKILLGQHRFLLNKLWSMHCPLSTRWANVRRTQFEIHRWNASNNCCSGVHSGSQSLFGFLPKLNSNHCRSWGISLITNIWINRHRALCVSRCFKRSLVYRTGDSVLARYGRFHSYIKV